jgi:hypothetical protein
MKKQIVAAAVAATMSAVALADISITGAAKVNFTNVDTEGAAPDSNKFTQEMDLKVKGKSGDTEVVINFGGGALDGDSLVNSGTTKNDDTGSAVDGEGNQMNVEDAYVTTKVGDISIKAGTWDNGNNELRASSRNAGKFQATTKIGNIDLGMLTSSAGASAEEYTVGTNLGGVAVSFTQKQTGETIKAETSFNGVNVKYLGLPSDTADSDREYVELSTKVGDLGIKVGNATTDSGDALDGDTWLGDFEGNTSGSYMLTADQDILGIELTTNMAGNKVTYRNISVDGVSGEDTDINKFIVTRPLASGATFELTYTDVDDQASGADSSTLDLELAVNF